MEELIYSLQEGIIGRLWSHVCNGMNEPPRAAMREMALSWSKKEGPGWGPCGKGGQKVSAWHEELRNRRTEAMGSGGSQTSGLFGLHTESK